MLKKIEEMTPKEIQTIISNDVPEYMKLLKEARSRGKRGLFLSGVDLQGVDLTKLSFDKLR